MPLSQPVERELLHSRDIAIRGYRRGDGCFDVEAELIDTKTYAFSVGDRSLVPGERLHNMVARITVDASLKIVSAEAATEFGPFAICGGGAATFSRLTGLVIRPGFLREVAGRIGGAEGCTHIRELVQQMATVAFQTSLVLKSRQRNDAATGDRMIDSCHAYSATGPVVRRRWPERYAGPPDEAAAAAG
jgi:hypothetical protein